METSRYTHAIYLSTSDARNVEQDLNKLIAKAKIQSVRTLAKDYGAVLRFQQALREITTPEETD